MSQPTPHFYQIKHAPGIVARISVNDIPFYQAYVEFNHSPAGPFNHFLLQGENEVTLDIAEPNPEADRLRAFELNVMRESDDSVLFRTRWPDFGEQYPEEERKLPIRHKEKFLFNEESPKPIWVDAPRESFSSEGTSEQHQAVFELWDAYNRQDIDGFLSAMELKTAEFQKFYGSSPELEANAARQQYGAQLRQPWDLEPFDPKELVFERRCEGRVAHVMRKDGGYALVARHKTDPVQTWQARLLLARVEGRWRIFW